MKFLNTLRKAQKIRVFAGFIIAGLIFSVLSCMSFFAPETEFADVEATIVNIEKEYDAVMEQNNYTVYVDYEVNGQKYTNTQYGGYSSSMKVGDTITIEYCVEDPTLIQSANSEFVPYVVLAAGLIAVISGTVMLIKSIKEKTDDMNEYDRVDMSSISDETVEAIRNSTEPQRKYYFHFDRHLKQGYVMENEYREAVYEAKCLTINPFKPFSFEFINHIDGSTKAVNIGHTVSTSIGSGSGFSYRIPISSSFTVDGVNNWDYLAASGFGFDFELKGIKPCFHVKHYGVEVAYIETAGTNALKEGASNPIGNLPVNGIFTVDCRQSDIEMIFMTCMSIARAIFYEND